MADHFEMDGIADYSIISGLQTTYIQRSTTALNRPICQNGKCKNMKNQLSGLKCTSLVISLALNENRESTDDVKAFLGTGAQGPRPRGYA